MTGCGASHHQSTITSTAPAGAHLLSGCYALPFSGGRADLLPVSFYRVTAATGKICFQRLSPGTKCSPTPAHTGQFGNPISAVDEPKSGNYSVVYYPTKRYWLFASGCPVSPSS